MTGKMDRGTSGIERRANGFGLTDRGTPGVDRAKKPINGLIGIDDELLEDLPTLTDGSYLGDAEPATINTGDSDDADDSEDENSLANILSLLRSGGRKRGLPMTQEGERAPNKRAAGFTQFWKWGSSQLYRPASKRHCVQIRT